MTKFGFILVVWFFTCTSASSQTFDMQSIADSRLSFNQLCPSWEITNTGTDPFSDIAQWTWSANACGEGTLRGLWRFDLNTPSTASMLYDNRATLYMFFPSGISWGHQYYGSATGNEFNIERVLDSWDEYTVTWNTQPAVTPLNSILVPSSPLNPGFNDYTIDISTLAHDWICGGEPNHGIRLSLMNEILYSHVGFTNREFADPLKRPFLRLEYAEINTVAPSSICLGDNFSIECILNNAADPTQYSFNWTHLQSGTTYNTPLVNSPQHSPGLNTYEVVVSNPWCQTASLTININVGEYPASGITSDNGLALGCLVSNTTLTPAGTGSYLWSTGSTSPSIVVSSAGTYDVTVTDPFGCSTTGSATITADPTPDVVATPSSQNICSGQSTNINLTSNTAGTTFNWTVSQAGVAGATAGSGTTIAQSLTATGGVTGTASYTITPSLGTCTGTPISVDIIVNPIPDAVATPSLQNICSGQSININLTSNTAGTTFNWTVSQAGAAGATAGSGTTISQTLTATGAAVGAASYTITPSLGTCTGTPTTVPITVNPNPAVIATPSLQNICSGQSININLTSNTAGTTFNWTVSQAGAAGATAGSGTTIAQTLTATGAAAGTASYTITPSLGTCTGTPTIAEISINPTPDAAATPSSQTICSGQTININLTSNTPGTTFVWTANDTQITGSVAGSGETIVQTLIATDGIAGTANYTIIPISGACTGIPTTVLITVNPAPNVAFSIQPQLTLISNPEISIYPEFYNPNDLYQWNLGDGSGLINGNVNSHSYRDTGNYCIRLWVQSAGGCQDSSMVCLRIQPEFHFYIPSAFTPNGDGINDVFEPKGEYIKGMRLMIFDRWGGLIFDKRMNHIVAWDGGNYPQGNYKYIIELSDFNNQALTHYGNITLIR